MSNFLKLLSLLIPVSAFAVQSIDLRGEFPPNKTIIQGISSGQLFGYVRGVGDLNSDLNPDIIVNAISMNGSSVSVFLNPIPVNQVIDQSNSNFILLPPNANTQIGANGISNINGDTSKDLLVNGIIWGGSDLNALTGSYNVDSLTNLVTIGSPSTNTKTGISQTGDLNGDDYDDFLVPTITQSFVAGMRIFYGASILPDSIFLATEGDISFDSQLNTHYAFLKDLNEDAFSDIILSYPNYLPNLIKVIYGAGNIPTVLNDGNVNLTIQAKNSYLDFGTEVSTGKFFSSNGKDLAIREGKNLSGNPSAWTEQRIFLLSNQQIPQSGTLDLDIVTPAIQFSAEFGLDSFLGFDFQKVNDDEFDDLVITDEISGGDWEGKVYVYFGGNPNLSGQIPLSNETADLVILGGKTNDYIQYPEFVDLNSDGYKDTIIPIPGYDTATQSGVGAVMIVWGDSLGFDNDPIPSAGNDQIGEIDSLVFLDGSETYDIDGDSLSFLWTQVSGTSVNLQGANQETASFVVPNTATNGEELIFSLEVTSNAFVVYDTTKVTVLDPTISAGENSNLPQGFSLSQNFPNPFNPTTVISYQLPVNSGGKLVVFNILGEVVKELELSENKGSVVWNGTDSFGKEVGSGIYFYRLEFGKIRETKKMLLLR